MDARDDLIFGRYTREECGLPRRPYGASPFGFRLTRALLLLALLLGAGWLGGSLTARWRELWVSQLPALALRAGPEETSRLLAQGRVYATALPERPGIRRNLARAVAMAAERSPRRLGYYGNLGRLLAGDGARETGNPTADFFHNLTASAAAVELRDYAGALAGLSRAETALDRVEDDEAKRSYRLMLANTRAYVLATAPEDQGRDPERALRLAELMISSRDELPGGGHASGSAALLDTLASAYHASGLGEKAAATQSLALGLAESDGLDVYVRHYDEFSRTPQNTTK